MYLETKAPVYLLQIPQMLVSPFLPKVPAPPHPDSQWVSTLGWALSQLRSAPIAPRPSESDLKARAAGNVRLGLLTPPGNPLRI